MLPVNIGIYLYIYLHMPSRLMYRYKIGRELYFQYDRASE